MDDNMQNCKPIPGSIIFNSLANQECIVMACNLRITKGVARGIFRAAKDLDAPVLFEIARSESDLNRGYTGMTPADYSKNIGEAAEEVGFDIWALHADHIGVKKGDQEDIEETKELVQAQIDAGFTSFAIDASHLFNFDGKTVEEELAPNIKATIEIARFIKENKEGEFGFEVEVGEIGRKDDKGMILTTPEEAVAFVKALNEADMNPQILATSNGSAHGNRYDDDGNLIEQISIDIKRTKEIVQALKDNNLNVRIAQHGITGTPRELIHEKFPHGDIIKGNVGTFWQNLFFDVLKNREPELYKKMYEWTISTFKEDAEKKGLKNNDQIFGIFGKKSIKQYFDEIYSISDETEKEIEEKSYEEAKEFFKAFKSENMAAIVREELNR
ncbi:class II fructose-bisphosphate aldolase [Candidatus Woesearchaeota archaeon]|nr:class II fructose-bisphosphate aldolase [Candidatus Woesearchaeota archaeon]